MRKQFALVLGLLFLAATGITMADEADFDHGSHEWNDRDGKHHHKKHEETETPEATATPRPTETPKPTETLCPTKTPQPTQTASPTVTAKASSTATGTPQATATASFTATPQATATVTATTTASLTATPQAAQAMVNLGSAANYVVLAYSAITNSGPTTLCGSLGLFPGTSVSGAPVVACGGTTDIANAAANTAKLDLSNAYAAAAGRTGGALLPPGDDLGGQTLYPGLYTDMGNLSVSSGNLTLDAKGNPNAVFIFQVNGVLNATTGRQVILAGGANAANIFWQVTGYCSLGTGVSFKGNIMAYTAVTMDTGAVLVGRALAENANVTMLSNSITKP